MFAANIKSSLLVLPWLLVPLAVYVFFITAVDPWIQDNGYALRNEMSSTAAAAVAAANDVDESFDEEEFFDEEEMEYTDGFTEEVDEWGDSIEGGIPVYRWTYSNECFGVSTALAIISNMLFLLIFPCALGGFDAGIKRGQYYLGFFINLAALIAMPVIYFLVYELDHTTFIILLALHTVSFMGTYIVGSRFVSPAYRKAFWFA